MPDCESPYSELYLVTVDKDGNYTRLNLLRGDKSGYWLDAWTPSIAGYKGGAVRTQSQYAPGSRPVMGVWDDEVDVFSIAISKHDQDKAINKLRDLFHILIAGVSYWFTDWQDYPLWIEARAKRETHKRYTLVKMWNIPGHNNPFKMPFINPKEAALHGIQLTIEHALWTDYPPIADPCETQETETISANLDSLLFNATTSVANFGSDATLDNIPDFAVSARGMITAEGWFRPDSLGEGDIGYLFSKYDGVTGFKFHLNPNNSIRADIICVGGNATSLTQNNAFIPDGEEHHLLMCYDETGTFTPAARKIYIAIDGEWIAVYNTQQASIGNYSGDAALDLLIGNRFDGNGTFDGNIGWCRVWDSIPRLPASGDFVPPPRCEQPATGPGVMLLSIIEGTTTTAPDYSGNDNDGTLTDTVWEEECTDTLIMNVDCNCVQTSGTQLDWWYEDWAVNTAQPVGQVNTLIDTNCGYMISAGNNDVWRTNTGGAVWVAAAAPPAMNVLAMIESPTDGYLYAAGDGGVYRSVDCGDNWVLMNAAATVANLNTMVEFKGDLYISRGATVERSTDGGATWVVVYNTNTSLALCATKDYIYLGTTTGPAVYAIVRSSNGTAWQDVAGPSLPCYTIVQLSDGFLYAGTDSGTIHRSATGAEWSLWGQTPTGFANVIQNIILDSEGRYFCCDDGSVVWMSYDAITWIDVVNNAGDFRGLVEFSGNGRVYAGWTGDIYVEPESIDVGREDTCTDEVFIANKANVAQLTHILVYDASAGTYTEQFPGDPPFYLLPSPFALNDAVYFGIVQGIQNYAPFCSLVFDIVQPLLETFPSLVRWQYWDGVAAAWGPLNVQDGTDASTHPFSRTGVNSVSFVPPDTWDPVAVNGITAYWVRVLVNLMGTWQQSPVQGHRDVYTTTWACIDVDKEQVGGDTSALLRMKLRNRSDENGYDLTELSEIDLMDNRVIVGLRKLERGEQFRAYINLADDSVVGATYSQNPIGIEVTDGDDSITEEVRNAPAGIACIHYTTGNGLTTYDDAAVVDFSAAISRDYYGKFRAFVRAHLYEPETTCTVEPSGDFESVRVRLKLQTGSGGIIEYSDFQMFNAYDLFDAVNGFPYTYKDYQLLDFDVVTLPISGLIRSDERPDTFSITIQVASDEDTVLRVAFYDLVLIPVDEWPSDMIDTALEDDSCVDNGYVLDCDSMTYPKMSIRSQVRTDDEAEFIKSAYMPVGPAPAILQERADQRLWFLCARAVVLGVDDMGAGDEFLADATQYFYRAGVRPGMTVYNLTTGESATITYLDEGGVATTAIVGSWNLGDEYMIIAPNWRSEPWVLHSIQLWATRQYLDMRGAG